MTSPQPPQNPTGFRLRAPNNPQDFWELIGPDAKPVAQANRFLHAVSLRGLTPSSLRAYAYDLLCALRWLHATSRSLSSLCGDSLLEFIEYQKQPPPAAPATINRRLAVLQRLLAFLSPTALSQASPPVPWPGRPRRRHRASPLKVRAPKPLLKPLTEQAALAFFRSLHTARDRALTLAMWVAGLRACEILALELSDVDFLTMSLKVLGKGRKERMLPLAEPLAKALLQYLACERPARSSPRFFVVLKGPRRGRPMTYSGLHRLFRHHRSTSGIGNANPHRFRHTFGAMMTCARLPLATLATLMGHCSPQTTLRYIQLNDQQVRHQYEEALALLKARGEFDERSVAPDR